MVGEQKERGTKNKKEVNSVLVPGHICSRANCGLRTIEGERDREGERERLGAWKRAQREVLS